MWIFFFVASLLGIGYEAEIAQLAALRAQTQLAVQREDQQTMGVLLASASAYVTANPGASGNVALTSLNLPSWFKPPPGAGVDVQSPKVIYAYMPIVYAPEASRLVAALTTAGFIAGFARGGTLYSTTGSAVTSAPAGIPSNATTVRYPQ